MEKSTKINLSEKIIKRRFHSINIPPEKKIEENIKKLKKQFSVVEIQLVEIERSQVLTVHSQNQPVDFFKIFTIFKCF